MLEQVGTSEEEFRETLTTELKIRKLIEGQSEEKLEASDEEIKAFYDENREQFERPESVTASHILLTVDPTATDEEKATARKQLEDIRTKLSEGADFAEMAMEHSSCPSKAQGGSLGSFPRGRMVPAFEEAAFSQEIGKVGDIVETQFGYHLIKVDSRDEAGLTPLDEVQEQLGQYLSNQKQQKVVQGYVEELRKTAEITYPTASAAPAPVAIEMLAPMPEVTPVDAEIPETAPADIK
jgi:peptidyl-prolyl cis-trans isomerase C